MSLYLNPKKLKERCKDPTFCMVCCRNRYDVPVYKHHVCKECRKGTTEIPRRLPAVTLNNGKTYFVDERLRQLRNVINPHDSINW